MESIFLSTIKFENIIIVKISTCFTFRSIFRFYCIALAIFFIQSTTPGFGNQRSVAVIGDSLTQGYGLKATENFVSVLQNRLNENNHKVQLINFGVSGDTTSGGLERFEWSVSSGVDGVVINLGANDMLRGISPELTYSNLQQMLGLAEEKGLPVLLIGIDAGDNYGKDFKISFRKIFQKLKNDFNILLYPNFFQSLISGDTVDFLSFMQNDNIHPNKKGVEKIVDDFYPLMEIFLGEIGLANF